MDVDFVKGSFMVLVTLALTIICMFNLETNKKGQAG